MKKFVVLLLVLFMVFSVSAKYQSKKDPLVVTGLRGIPSPEWVFGPNIERDDYIYFKADAKRISESLARTSAELECATRASRQIGQAVSYSLENIQKEMTTKEDFVSDAVGLNIAGAVEKSMTQSATFLKGLELLDEWFDVEGRIYVLMGIPVEIYEKLLYDIIEEEVPEKTEKELSTVSLASYNLARNELESLFVTTALDRTEELVDTGKGY